MSEAITRPGIYKISNKEYHADPCIEPSLSRGTIMHLLNDTPAHAAINHPRLNPDYKPENNSKYDIGSAAHSLLLEGLNQMVIVVADDWRTKAAKEARDAAYSEGKTPLLEKDANKVLAMVEAAEKVLAESELNINNLQAEGMSERSYFWQENGVWCRVRLDWLKHDRSIALDYKTTSTSANPNYFGRNMAQFGYDVQSVFYPRGVKAVDGVEPAFYFLVQEMDEPYLCSLITLSPQFREMAKEKVSVGMEIWRHCRKAGKWPGYPTRICHIDPPSYALTEWEMRAFSLRADNQEEMGL